MKEKEIRAIVEPYYQVAQKYCEQPILIAVWVAQIKDGISRIEILSKEELNEQLAAGYEERYCSQSDVGVFVWDEGEMFVGQCLLESWANSSRRTLEEGIESEAEHFIKYSTLKDILGKKNGLLRKIREKIQELEQIRRNIIQNMEHSEATVKAYQEMSLDVIEKCQQLLRAALKAL